MPPGLGYSHTSFPVLSSQTFSSVPTQKQTSKTRFYKLPVREASQKKKNVLKKIKAFQNIRIFKKCPDCVKIEKK